jgi:hypothetical protein
MEVVFHLPKRPAGQSAGLAAQKLTELEHKTIERWGATPLVQVNQASISLVVLDKERS